MPFKAGLNQKILKRLLEQLFEMLDRYSKVLVVRFELNFYDNQSNNKTISKFRTNLTKKLKKKYGEDIGYIWVREQATRVHYHLAFFLNGHKAHKSFGISELVQRVCFSLPDLSPYFPDNNTYMLKRQKPETMTAAIFRLSYLAKNETKETRERGKINYQTSRLQHKKSYIRNS